MSGCRTSKKHARFQQAGSNRGQFSNGSVVPIQSYGHKWRKLGRTLTVG